MIRASCHKCNRVIHYHAPTTLEEVESSKRTLLRYSDCDHDWIIKKMELGFGRH